MNLKTEQIIHGELAAKHGNFIANFTTVYGLHAIDHRRPLWSSLVQVGASVTHPWFIMG